MTKREMLTFRRPDHVPTAPTGPLLLMPLLLVAILLSGCASLVVADTTPLAPSQMAPLGSESISTGGFRLSALTAAEATPDLLVLVAISGGGKRSAAYSYGALEGMRDVSAQTAGGPQPLLSLVDGISGISGGSFTAAYYGLYRDAAFGRFEKDFLYADTNAYVWGVFLLPWNWGWLVDPTVGTNDYMEQVYDRTMFHGARFKDLAARGRPLIVIGATELSSGKPFVFTQENFDLICSDLAQFPVARAVAASNGFPGLFSPVTLTNHAAKCGGREPGWLRRVTQAELRDPLSRIGVEAQSAARYLDQSDMRYVHLNDGGISDNLGLRAMGSMMQNVTPSREALAAFGLDRLRRILVISVDGQNTQDLSVSQRRIVGGLFALFGLVAGGTIDRFNFETMVTFDQQLRNVTEAIRAARCAQGPTIDGSPCEDVQSAFVQVSLSAMPPGADRDRLLAIPTGLTIERTSVDALIRAGHDAITTSDPLRRFLRSYPARASVYSAMYPGTQG